MNETPNDGFIRYFGVFHGERLLLTNPQATKDMMLLQPYNYNKIKVAKKIIGHITGPGLIVVDQDEHRVRSHAFFYKECLLTLDYDSVNANR